MPVVEAGNPTATREVADGESGQQPSERLRTGITAKRDQEAVVASAGWGAAVGEDDERVTGPHHRQAMSVANEDVLEAVRQRTDKLGNWLIAR